MPETDVIVRFVGEDDLSAYIQHLAGEMQNLAQVTHEGFEPEIIELMNQTAGAIKNIGTAAQVTNAQGLEPEIEALQREAEALQKVTQAAEEAAGATKGVGGGPAPTYPEFGGKTYTQWSQEQPLLHRHVIPNGTLPFPTVRLSRTSGRKFSQPGDFEPNRCIRAPRRFALWLKVAVALPRDVVDVL
jgi:hypothetical protein